MKSAAQERHQSAEKIIGQMFGFLAGTRTARLNMSEAAILILCASEARAFPILEICDRTGLDDLCVRRRGQALVDRQLVKQTLVPQPRTTGAKTGPRQVIAFHVTVGGVETARKVLGLKRGCQFQLPTDGGDQHA